MTDDIVTRLRDLWSTSDNMWQINVCNTMSDAADEIERLRNRVAEQEITHAVQKQNTMTEIERLRKDLELAIHVKQFVSFWWDDPSKVGECCAAWDNLPEEVRMWVLE